VNEKSQVTKERLLKKERGRALGITIGNRTEEKHREIEATE
jgi:hypothetical protein